MTSTLPLPSLFARSLSLASKASDFPTTNAETQDIIQSSLTDLRTLQSRIAGLSLFSPNETLEDISTRDLVYLLVPYVYAQVQDRVKTVSKGERLPSLVLTKNLLLDFLQNLDNYEIIPETQRALYDKKATNPASRRELKIKQYQTEKDLRARIETIRKRRDQRRPPTTQTSGSTNDFDLIASLLPTNTEEEEEQDDSSTDDIVRETTLLLIRVFFAQAQNQLQNIEQELELLRNAPSSPPTTIAQQEMEDKRGKRKESEDNMWKLDAPAPKVGANGPLLDEAGKPLQPFTILPSGAADRARLQAQIFGPGHNLPTMSIDEYLEIERQRGKFISGGGAASQNAPTTSEQLALDAEMDGTVEGEEKSEAKRIKDEDWARFTDENPRGAGNTMNRG